MLHGGRVQRTAAHTMGLFDSSVWPGDRLVGEVSDRRRIGCVTVSSRLLRRHARWSLLRLASERGLAKTATRKQQKDNRTKNKASVQVGLSCHCWQDPMPGELALFHQQQGGD